MPSKQTAGLLAILLGDFGVHKFYLGSWGWGIVFVGFVLLTGFLGIFITGIIGIVEAIQIFRLSDQEFAQKYSPATKSPWRW